MNCSPKHIKRYLAKKNAQPAKLPRKGNICRRVVAVMMPDGRPQLLHVTKGWRGYGR